MLDRLVRPNANRTAGDGDGVAAIDEEEGVGDAEEVRQPQTANMPVAPTQAQIDEHLPLHLPYRYWCPDCVAGEAVSTQHRPTGEDTSEVTWNIDDCYLVSKAESGLIEVDTEWVGADPSRI